MNFILRNILKGIRLIVQGLFFIFWYIAIGLGVIVDWFHDLEDRFYD